MLLFSGDVFKQVATAPPRDLASLLNPGTVLTTLQVKTDEDSLIAVLTAPNQEPRAEAAGNGDVEYLKQLLAMRRLEQVKSQRALPALDALARQKDVTLADAARQAAARQVAGPLRHRTIP